MYLSSVIVMQDGIPYNIGAVGNYPYTSNKIMFFLVLFVCFFCCLIHFYSSISFRLIRFAILIVSDIH